MKKEKATNNAALPFTHVASATNTTKLKKMKNYEESWIIPEMPTTDPLYGLNLRAVIGFWKELHEKTKAQLHACEQELNQLKARANRSWFTKLKTLLLGTQCD